MVPISLKWTAFKYAKEDLLKFNAFLLNCSQSEKLEIISFVKKQIDEEIKFIQEANTKEGDANKLLISNQKLRKLKAHSMFLSKMELRTKNSPTRTSPRHNIANQHQKLDDKKKQEQNDNSANNQNNSLMKIVLRFLFFLIISALCSGAVSFFLACVAALIFNVPDNHIMHIFFCILAVATIITMIGFYSPEKRRFKPRKIKDKPQTNYISADKLFISMDPSKRNTNVETIVKYSINNQKELWSYNQSASGCCLSESRNVDELQKPAYLSAASYCALYLDNNLDLATKYGLSCLKELDCYSKEDILLDIYQWFVTEEKISNRLFDEQGYTRIPNNPYRTNSKNSIIENKNISGKVPQGSFVPIGNYECLICGYKYDSLKGDLSQGVKAGVPFEKLPENWTCPVCGADKDVFSRESHLLIKRRQQDSKNKQKPITEKRSDPFASAIDVESLPKTLKERIGHVAIGLQIALVSGRLTEMPNNDKAIWENGSLFLAYLEDLKIIDSQKSRDVVDSFSRSYPNKDEGRECNKWMTDSVSFYKVELLSFLKGAHKLPDVIVYNITHHSKEKVDFNNLPIIGMDMLKITQTWAVIRSVFDSCFYNQKEKIAKMPVDSVGSNAYQADEPYPEIKQEIKKDLSKKMQDTFPWLERNCIDDKKFAHILRHIGITIFDKDTGRDEDLLVCVMTGLELNLSENQSFLAPLSGYIFIWFRYVCLSNIVFYRNILSVCFNKDSILHSDSERKMYVEKRLDGLGLPESQLDDIYLILKGYMDTVHKIGKIASDIVPEYYDDTLNGFKDEAYLNWVKGKYKDTEKITELLDLRQITEVFIRDFFEGKRVQDIE